MDEKGRMNMSEISVKFIIASHKKCDIPEDELYLPVQVGAAGKEDLGYTRDCTGDNISELNPYFCELTGLYWAWKNLKVDYLGLVHYRRYFKGKGRGKDKLCRVMTLNEANGLLNQYTILVPQKRKYYIETLYSHYAHTFSGSQLDCAREIIAEKFPEYVDSFDATMKRRSAYMFNMFVMPKALVDEYCAWLFEILFELKKRIDTAQMTDFEARFCGRVSELLFNVWLNQKIKGGKLAKSDVKEVKWLYLGKVNFFKKGVSFLMAKFFHKKYDKSF